jgi:hypothetical protein
VGFESQHQSILESKILRSSVFKFDKTAPDGFKWGFQLDDDPERICFSKLYGAGS